MPITKEQALELADKYFIYTGKFILKDNISVRKSDRGWQIVAKTTPAILGMQTEITTFTIDSETGEVGVSITSISITNILREINERKDLHITKKEELKTKIGEFEKYSTKEPVDKNKMTELKKWFENNAPYLKSIIDLINSILKLGSSG